jgi:hypothetical protein
MGSKARRSNPHLITAGGTNEARDAWNEGYDAALYNDTSGGDSPYVHDECDDCMHRRKQQYNLKVMFTIEDTTGTPSLDATELAEQLAEALPKEWWQDSNMAEWGTVAIHPLDSDGKVFPF